MARSGTAIAIVAVFLSLRAFAQLEPTETQYSVYSAFLREQLNGAHGIDDLRVGERGSTISPVIEPFRRPVDRKELSDIKARLPEVEAETLESLASCTANSYRLTPKLELPIKYILAPPEQANRRFGYIEFSCVGMNRPGRQAIFYVSRLKCDCAVGKLVLMRKLQDGTWVIAKEIVLWIA